MEFKRFTPEYVKARILELNATLPDHQRQVLCESRMDTSDSFDFIDGPSPNNDIARFAKKESMIYLILAILYLLPLQLQYAGKEKKNERVTSRLTQPLRHFFNYDVKYAADPVVKTSYLARCLAPLMTDLITQVKSYYYIRECFVLAMMINGIPYDFRKDPFQKDGYKYFYFHASKVPEEDYENVYNLLMFHRLSTSVLLPKLQLKFERKAVHRRQKAYEAIRTTMLSAPRFLPSDIWRIIASIVIDDVYRTVV